MYFVFIIGGIPQGINPLWEYQQHNNDQFMEMPITFAQVRLPRDNMHL